MRFIYQLAILNALVLFLSISCRVDGLDNGLALTPPMGFSTWNTFACNISEDIIKGVADVMVSSGLRDAGYVYVNIDDCWEGGRDAQGQLYADHDRFPSGIGALADYIHSKGMKLGIYTSSGEITCMGNVGSKGYEIQDAKTFASWNVDYLKLDCCNTTTTEERINSYTNMSLGLLNSGRPIVFSCDTDELLMRTGNTEAPWDWAPAACNLARLWLDIKDSWKNLMDILDHASNVMYASRPGFWNDLDILTVGMGALSWTEYKTHFSLWCMLNSPLLLGNDIRNMSKQALDIVTAPELIGINQDPLGIAGEKIRTTIDGTGVFYAKPLTGVSGTVAVALFNRAEVNQVLTLDFYTDVYQNNFCCPPPNPPIQVTMRDLWARKDIGIVTNQTSFLVEPHGVVVLRLTPITP